MASKIWTPSSVKSEGAKIVTRRHVEWRHHNLRWQWLLDSYEGGQRYRDAVYGKDRGGLPLRNLVRHKREYPDPKEFTNQSYGLSGTISPSAGLDPVMQFGPFPGQLGADQSAPAQDDDYEMRRARTPVPEWVKDAVECHLGKIYDQEIKREGPDNLTEWWKDVDGIGTPIDEWMSETVAPLLMVLGMLDILFDHPPAPEGAEINTQADAKKYRLTDCRASYILPENMVWWRLDASGQYQECLVKEYVDPALWEKAPKPGDTDEESSFDKTYCRFRHWTASNATLYDYDGNMCGEPYKHNFKRVPIKRLIDIKRHRSPHVGKSRYESVAELQREYYNRDSELILSDTLQAHPLLSGPEDFCKGDGKVSIGPGFVLPKFKGDKGDYIGWEFVSPPKDPAESIRMNKIDIQDSAHRAAKMTKPAGSAGKSGGTVSQSGISKQLDSDEGNKLLSRVAKVLAKAEREIAEFALIVLGDKEPDPKVLDTIKIVYPSRFDLFSIDELTAGITEYQAALAAAGESPLVEAHLCQTLVRRLLPGMDDEEYEEFDTEIDQVMEAKAKTKEAASEAGLALSLSRVDGPGVSSSSNALADDANDEQGAESDPTGQSGATAVTNDMPPTVA